MEDVIKSIFASIEKDRLKARYYEDAFEAIKILFKEDKQTAFKYNASLRTYIETAKKASTSILFLRQVENIRKETYHLEAQDIFDSYLIYVEWNRPPEKKFYLPRRKVLKRVADSLQDLEERKIKFLGVSLPRRVGKSTLCIFFMTWVMGKHPETASVMSGHSDKLTNGFYNEILSIITDDNTYLWDDVFPENKIANTSAFNETIDLNKTKRFSTLTCRSITGTLTGAVEVGSDGILYCDDLVEDLEEALNLDRLDKKYNAYLNQLKDGCKDGAAELMVGTRWNVLDPLGRIKAEHENDPLYRFIVIPALDENDESNFQYDYGVGFSTQYYHEMRVAMNPADWWAKCMGQPYVREGLLFPHEELNYYDGKLPDGKPDRIISVIDVAWGGGDYFSMPMAYVYKDIEGDDVVYIFDVIFTKGSKEVTYPMVAGMIQKHNPYSVQIEANNGGAEFRDKIEAILLKNNFHTNISTRRCPTTTSKKERIYRYSGDIKKFYFLDMKHRGFEYRKFMENLTTFVMEGKNKNDDAPDSLALLVTAIFNTYGKVTVFERPI